MVQYWIGLLKSWEVEWKDRIKGIYVMQEETKIYSKARQPIYPLTMLKIRDVSTCALLLEREHSFMQFVYLFKSVFVFVCI